MAQIDFTNAVLTPYGNNPLSKPIMDIDTFTIYDSTGTTDIATSKSFTQVSMTKKEYKVVLQGTMTASGNQFLIAARGTIIWKISNISFASGDTFALRLNHNIAADYAS